MEPGVHFFLDFQRKPPYKGDTTALSQSGAKFDVKGESIDEERNEEESACEEKGCSEEKEVVQKRFKFEFNPIGPEESGPFLFCAVLTFAHERRTPPSQAGFANRSCRFRDTQALAVRMG